MVSGTRLPPVLRPGCYILTRTQPSISALIVAEALCADLWQGWDNMLGNRYSVTVLPEVTPASQTRRNKCLLNNHGSAWMGPVDIRSIIAFPVERVGKAVTHDLNLFTVFSVVAARL